MAGSTDALRYEYGGISSAVAAAHRFSNNVKGLLGDAASSLNKYASDTDGAYAAAFQAAQRKLHQAGTTIEQSAAKFAMHLEEGASNMNSTDVRWANTMGDIA
ncbi:MAG TPA: hypothetical protein VE172_04570 [Stackebrandtia sp.]|jgi:uncharacterized protein YukE|uniref:WXG100 family type VII secretion target n=1 Tax=Stackebrandtia sp. TaxID=2023065 RepID=UPI002D39E177|nr:hypothetical protein [Stackebrandtia sp.]HZE38067.1 hypothetical protein [Stackebrandtia sp.]